MNTELATSTELRATCSRDELAGALGTVSRGLSSRGAVQVLNGILLRGDEGRLTLAATDMEISLRATIAGDISGDGAVVVPGRLLTDLTRLLPDDSVTLAHEEGDGVLVVTSGSHSSRLNVYSAEDFPRLPPTDVPLHVIAAPALRRPVPELQAAAAGDVRGRGDDVARAAPAGDPPRRRPRAAQRSASSPLRGGGARGLRPDAGRGRGARDTAARLRGRSARDRVQPRLSARRPRGRSRRLGAAEADQPAPSRPDRLPGRELLVPDHADPAP